MTEQFQQLVPGVVFAGEYRVIGRLSEGAMGAVYTVEQISTGKQRALKLMHPQLLNDERLRQRFVQEARIGAQIDSDHVVEVVGAGIDSATSMPWLAMELLRGETLAALLARSGPLSPATVQEIYSQLMHALSAAHAAGVVHRDLKPENIFVANSKREGVPFMVKVLDFGIAKLVADASTRSTVPMGTPLWMAPEQSESRMGVSPATDVWALGLIAFHLLTGRYYWREANTQDGSTMALLREILMEPIEPATERARQFGCSQLVPRSFDPWFLRCLERKPADRFADAQQARAGFPAALGAGQLGNAATQHGAPPAASTVMMPTPAPQPAWRQSAPSTPMALPQPMVNASQPGAFHQSQPGPSVTVQANQAAAWQQSQPGAGAPAWQQSQPNPAAPAWQQSQPGPVIPAWQQSQPTPPPSTMAMGGAPAAPVIPYAPYAPPERRSSSSTPLIAGLAVGVLLLGGLAFALMSGKKSDPQPQVDVATNAVAASTAKASSESGGLVPIAKDTSPEPTVTAEPSSTKVAIAAPPTTTAPRYSPPTTTPTYTAPTYTAARPTATEAPAAEADTFDDGAARASLASIPYVDCSGDGTGIVSVIFDTSGSVTSASSTQTSGDTWLPAITNCVNSRFRRASVPPFSSPKGYHVMSWRISF